MSLLRRYLLLTRNGKKSYSSTYAMFKNIVGSQHIASLKALKTILKYSKSLEKNDSNSTVLEIGTGIGTVAYLVTKNTNLNYLAYETNDFCIDQLNQNVDSVRMTVVGDFNDLLAHILLGSVSFLIIDDIISKKDLRLLLSRIKPKYIFIEGHRFKTRKELLNLISEKNLGYLFLIRFFISSFHSSKGGMLVRFYYKPILIPTIILRLITVYSILRFNIVNNYVIYRIFRFCGSKLLIKSKSLDVIN